jgi:mycothiol synthase
MGIDFERPSTLDLDHVFDLITRSDIAEYGEPDSELSDLQHEWDRVEIGQDIWLAKSADAQVIGYGAVVPSRGELRFDVYIDPEIGTPKLTGELLQRCEIRAQELVGGEDIAAHTFLAHVNQQDKEVYEGAGYEYKKSYYQMHIDLTEINPPPRWPDGVSLRTAKPNEDDEAIYHAVQQAFERGIEEEPTFEQWRDHMIRSDIYDPKLWFLAISGDEIVGICLGIKYEKEGWIRQFGVVPDWRGKGIATALLQHAFQVFRKRGYPRAGLGMEADNERAMRFYDRAGMKVLRRYDEYSKVFYPSRTGKT